MSRGRAGKHEGREGEGRMEKRGKTVKKRGKRKRGRVMKTAGKQHVERRDRSAGCLSILLY